MATIDDIGADDPLGSPPLGGPNGWAAAVRDAIRDRLPLTGGTLTGQTRIDTTSRALGLLNSTLGAAAGAFLAPDAAGALRVTNADNSGLANVECATPIAAGHAATKGYVDTGKAYSFIGIVTMVQGNPTYCDITVPAPPAGYQWSPMVAVESGHAQWMGNNGYALPVLYASMLNPTTVRAVQYQYGAGAGFPAGSEGAAGVVCHVVAVPTEAQTLPAPGA